MTDDKNLVALASVTDRLSKLEFSQRVRDEGERILGAIESGMFSSAPRANMRSRPMTIHALGSTMQKTVVSQAHTRTIDASESMLHRWQLIVAFSIS